MAYKLSRLFGHTLSQRFPVGAPCSAAYFRTSSVIFIEQKCGPHMNSFRISEYGARIIGRIFAHTVRLCLSGKPYQFADFTDLLLERLSGQFPAHWGIHSAPLTQELHELGRLSK